MRVLRAWTCEWWAAVQRLRLRRCLELAVGMHVMSCHAVSRCAVAWPGPACPSHVHNGLGTLSGVSTRCGRHLFTPRCCTPAKMTDSCPHTYPTCSDCIHCVCCYRCCCCCCCVVVSSRGRWLVLGCLVESLCVRHSSKGQQTVCGFTRFWRERHVMLVVLLLWWCRRRRSDV